MQPAPEHLLLTSRLRLEPLTLRHAPLLYDSLQEEALYAYIPQDSPTSLASLSERYQRLAPRHSPDGQELWLNWAIARQSPPIYVGTFEATVMADQTAWLAYMIFGPLQRQGYATEAGQAVIDELRRTYAVRVFYADIDTRNRGSIATIKALGFTQIATTKAADFFKGCSSDEYRFELRASTI